MKKNLLTIGILAITLSVQAQTTVLNVGNTAKMYVSKNTLVYNGGSVRLVGNGLVENHGNVMIVGTAGDTFTTVTSGGANKTPDTNGTTGIYAPTATPNFVNKLNEPTSFALRNKPDDISTTTINESQVYTYGQLFIQGLAQSDIQGYVDQEHTNVNHGAYQQIGMPFFNKAYSTLSTELGKTFTVNRGSQNDVHNWNNSNVVFDHVTNFSAVSTPRSYMILGNLPGASAVNYNSTKTFKGRPVSDLVTEMPAQTMANAGASITFGAGGGSFNQYNEKYNTYLQDGFHTSVGGTAWEGGFGKNLYQYSNPFLTNLDLSGIAATGAGDPDGDGNQLAANFQGVRLEVAGVMYSSAGGGSSSFKYVTRDPNGRLTVADTEYLNVRPMGTFVLKFTSPTSNTLNFQTLRRFNYLTRAQATPYSVTAAKNMNNNTYGTTKQLAVIALNSAGNEIGRTYYVVSNGGTTGNSNDAKMQVNAFSEYPIGTYEEAPAGGYDYNFTNSYWLYVNEANENNFLGKNIKLVRYNNNVTSYRFEVKEDGVLIADNAHALSSGTGFYFKPVNGSIQEARQGNIVPVSNNEYDLYYGAPSSGNLGTGETKTPSRTMVMYVPEINDYVVRFDPNWKKADITVYDMSGKLVISKKDVKTDKDFIIELDDNIKNGYIVNILSDNGDKVTTKILK